MAEEKVYTPATIEDQPLPQEGEEVSFGSSASDKGVETQKTIPNKTIPRKRVAVELIGTALNTKSRKILAEFQFTPSGALQIGTYENGVSGDIRISPGGIVARNISGITTFTLDGDTGDAIFAGELRSGSVITGQIIVGDNHIIIDGENKRIIINDGTTDRVLIGFLENGF